MLGFHYAWWFDRRKLTTINKLSTSKSFTNHFMQEGNLMLSFKHLRSNPLIKICCVNSCAIYVTFKLLVLAALNPKLKRFSSYLAAAQIHWSQVLIREWICNWSSNDRWCSDNIWMINNFIARGVAYIRGLTLQINIEQNRGAAFYFRL